MRKSGLIPRILKPTGAFLLLSGMGMLMGNTASADDAVEAVFANKGQDISLTAFDHHEKPACAPGADKCADDGKKANGGCDECGGDDGDCCDGRIMRLFDDCCGNNWLEDAGVSLSGWLAQGITFSDSNVKTANPGGDGLAPVGFASRPNDYQLNQFYLIASKDATTDDGSFGWGFQMDLLAGTDANRTKAAGWDDSWADTSELGLAMPQLYASFYWNGVTVNVGHFYTIIGYEVVTAPDNFFYSHALTMQFNEPFTHTGAIASYDLNDNLSISGGFTTGWDDFENENEEEGLIGGVNWTSDDERTSLALAIVHGEETVSEPSPGDFVTEDRTVYSIVASHWINDDLEYVIQHDWRRDDGATGDEDTEGYGINQYLFYQLTDKARFGMRFEWFRDDDNVIVNGGANSASATQGVNYFNLTTGINYNITDCLLIRPELRFDWADQEGTFHGQDATQDDQITAGADLILRF